MSPLLDEVRVWLRKASGDLLSARILVEQSPLVLGPAAFHCQQAAEKALKAFLVWRSVPFEKVHS
jgi:HEPN domain-containing protein